MPYLHVLILVLALTTAAFAQDKPVTLTVTQQELALLGRALGALPYNDVALLVGKLQAQVNEQQKPKEAPDAK